MCNDPNKVQVDWTKIATQSVGSATQTNLNNSQANPLITSCNEGASFLIGHENFGYNGADKKNKNR